MKHPRFCLTRLFPKGWRAGVFRRQQWGLLAGLLFARAIAAPAGVATPAQLQTGLNTNTQGGIVDLYTVDPLSCPQISMTQAFTGGKLIFSDSPESPTTRGILYQDTNLTATAAAIPNRVFVYHVNSNTVSQMRFSVLIKNNGSAAGTLTTVQSGLAGPSTSYAYVGAIAYYRWLTNVTAKTVTVAPGQTVRLDTNFDTTSVTLNYLINGIWDYTFTQPHTLIICALNPADDPVSVGPTLSVLARDGHERGTFAGCNKTYNTASSVVVDTAAGIQQFPIAGNGDNYGTGLDNAVYPPTNETNSGNYGVQYNMALATSASDGRALALVINPRAGAWDGAVAADPGLLPGGDFVVPTGGSTLSSNNFAVVAGEYFPNTSKTLHLQFMPTGASSFPVRLVTVPYVSTAPNLAAITNRAINAGQTVSFTASATDTNGNNPLSFSLPVAPAGASIGSATGLFSWRAPVASANSTQSVQVRVADSGSPPHSDIQFFSITVNPLGAVTLTASPKTNSAFQLNVAGPVGPDYILQASSSLGNSVAWTNLATNTPVASPFVFTDASAALFATRYYRILLGP